MAAVIIVALVIWCVCAVLVGPVVGGHLKRQAERQLGDSEEVTGEGSDDD